MPANPGAEAEWQPSNCSRRYHARIIDKNTVSVSV